MQPYYQKNDIALYHGDLRQVLPTLSKASVDYVVTDPPYGIGFMEKDWDFEVPGPEYWRAIARVCKPGAMLLAFGGTRTYHRLTCAIENAGWEIRDCLMWLYGQGMPKAGDIGKMIDKAKGATRKVVGTKVEQPGYSLADSGRTNEVYGDLHDPEAECAITAPTTAKAAKWTGWAMALKPAWEPIILAMKPMEGTIAHNAETWGVAGMNIDACRIGTDSTIRTRSNSLSDSGWDSANRSPVGGSECGRWPANLLLDKEAASLVDAQTGTLKSGMMKAGQQRSRSKGEGGYHGNMPNEATATGTYGDEGGASRFFYQTKADEHGHDQVGRWPANLLLDEEVAARLDEQVGPLKPTGRRSEESKSKTVAGTTWGTKNHKSKEYPGETGSASRFFYCAKASKRERNPAGMKNDHPTVKPLDLMKYLLTLLSTPEGGVILDPFAGSGTTLLAAKALGRRCIAVELDAHNCDIAVARLDS